MEQMFVTVSNNISKDLTKTKKFIGKKKLHLLEELLILSMIT